MAITKLSDVVSAASMQAFTPWFMKAYHDASNFLKSGIAATDSVIAERCRQAGFSGKTVNMPFWGDLQGDDEVLSDSSDISLNKIDADQDVAVITRRAKAFGITDLAVDLAGSDPMAWIASRLGAYWARRDEAKVLATLRAIFTASTGAGKDLLLDASSATLDKDTLLWAAQVLGDKKAELTGIAMNSAADAFLGSLDAKSTLYRGAEQPGQLPSYNGRKIVMDDNLAYDSTSHVAEIYLFGAGAVALNDVPSKTPLEAGRDPLKNGGEDYIVSRHANIAHVRGFAWKGTPSGATPTNVELGIASNWQKVYDVKDIRVVKLLTRLA